MDQFSKLNNVTQVKQNDIIYYEEDVFIRQGKTHKFIGKRCSIGRVIRAGITGEVIWKIMKSAGRNAYPIGSEISKPIASLSCGKNFNDIDVHDNYASGGKISAGFEKEIFEVLHSIRISEGSYRVFDYRESVLKSKLEDNTFEYLLNGESKYGKLQPYFGSAGKYNALNLTDNFFNESNERKRNERSGKMEKGGQLKVDYDFNIKEPEEVLKGSENFYWSNVITIDGIPYTFISKGKPMYSSLALKMSNRTPSKSIQFKSNKIDNDNFKSGGHLEGTTSDGKNVKLDTAKQGGMSVGSKHTEGGIKGSVGQEGKPIEFEGEEIILTAPVANATDKYEFDGKQMTAKEIASKLNVDNGGVAFADGGQAHSCKCSGKSYKFGGETISDREIINYINFMSQPVKDRIIHLNK